MWHHGEFYYPFEDPHKSNRKQSVDKDLLRALGYVTDWSLAVDGGAHVGVVARYLKKRFKSVIAIELAPDTTECLMKNCRDVHVINAALADRPGRVGYEGDQAETSSVRRVVSGDKVDVITIDGLGLDSLGFLKLDLQGYDYFALKGAAMTLRKFRPVVFFEHKRKCFSRYGVEDNDPKDFLKSCGYATLGAGINMIGIPNAH